MGILFSNEEKIGAGIMRISIKDSTHDRDVEGFQPQNRVFSISPFTMLYL